MYTTEAAIYKLVIHTKSSRKTNSPRMEEFLSSLPSTSKTLALLMTSDKKWKRISKSTSTEVPIYKLVSHKRVNKKRFTSGGGTARSRANMARNSNSMDSRGAVRREMVQHTMHFGRAHRNRRRCRDRWPRGRSPRGELNLPAYANGYARCLATVRGKMAVAQVARLGARVVRGEPEKQRVGDHRPANLWAVGYIYTHRFTGL